MVRWDGITDPALHLPAAENGSGSHFPLRAKARGCLLARGSDWSAGLAWVYELLSHRRGRRRALFEKVLMIT